MTEDIPKGTWVKLLPRELKGIEGKVLWRNGGPGGSYAVHIAYGEGRDSGAVIYVPPGDLRAIRDEPPKEPFPVDRVANDIITRHLGMLGLVDLKKLISDTWAGYEGLNHEDQYEMLKCVARKIYGGR